MGIALAVFPRKFQEFSLLALPFSASASDFLSITQQDKAIKNRQDGQQSKIGLWALPEVCFASGID